MKKTLATVALVLLCAAGLTACDNTATPTCGHPTKSAKTAVYAPAKGGGGGGHGGGGGRGGGSSSGKSGSSGTSRPGGSPVRSTPLFPFFGGSGSGGHC